MSGFERKHKVNFCKAFLIILFQNILFLEEFLHVMAVLGYLTKLERGLVQASGAHFLHDIPIKMFLV